MKRIFLTAAAMFALLQSYSQTGSDSTGFESRKLKLEEINLVSSYYNQDGNNSSVTGGIGTEKLSDIANVIDIKLTRYDSNLRKHTFTGEIGIDHYTSASSDKIDPKNISSASHADTRIYPSFSWSVENEKKGTTFGAAVSSSTEYDYQSFGGNINFSKKTKNKNGEFSAAVQVYLDRLKLIQPIELRPPSQNSGEDEHYSSTSRNSLSASLSYSQIISQRLQVMFLADVVRQTGYLSLPFHRVYFADGSLHQENLPGTRLKIPLGFRANYFLGDKFIIRAYYRYYTDDWGINSNTASLEIPVKITPFFSISPFYRYYKQSAAKYFAPYKEHTAQDQYYVSNYDLSNFNSNFFGTGIRLTPPKGVFGMQHLSMLELRYGHYTKDIGMNSNIISMNLKFK